MSAKTTIAVLDENELQDGQMKEVAFGTSGGKVLVAKLGPKIVSTSAYCTHYGAPLAKGVLTADGRIVCPWHGACFNACTGDIEDAPALFGIHSFDVNVKEGKICVTAEEKFTKKDDNLVRQMEIPPATTDATEGAGVVIVGGGSGAIHTVESLRENGYTKPITIFTLEDNAPIDRTKLSKALITDASKAELRTLSELVQKYRVKVHKRTAVTSINQATKVVILGDSSEVPYETLVLSPGATPRRLPIPGGEGFSNVVTLRNLDDTKQLDPLLQKDKNFVIIGSSFIGIEVVTAVAKRGLASVHVIGLESVPFENILGKEVGAGLQKGYEKMGATFHMSSGIKEIVGENGLATGVVLKDGTTLKADVVLMAVGVKPATEFLAKSGFKLLQDGGIEVDELLRLKGYKDIFAIGDIAAYPQAQFDKPRRIEHWNVAGNHGRSVGRTIAGKKPLPFEKIPIFWSAQGLRYCGIGVGFDDVIVQGSPAESKFIAYYAKGDKVVALASMGKDPVMSKSSELMRLGVMPSVAEIKAGVDPLQVDISSSAAFAKIKA